MNSHGVPHWYHQLGSRHQQSHRMSLDAWCRTTAGGVSGHRNRLFFRTAVTHSCMKLMHFWQQNSVFCAVSDSGAPGKMTRHGWTWMKGHSNIFTWSDFKKKIVKDCDLRPILLSSASVLSLLWSCQQHQHLRFEPRPTWESWEPNSKANAFGFCAIHRVYIDGLMMIN